MDKFQTLPQPAPDFSLVNQDNQTVSLVDFKDNWLVLYFYPKDNTPGCTKEACNFRDARADIEALGVKVVGVSADSVKSHKAFASKYHLNFELLSDSSHEVIEAYGSCRPLKIFGREVMGVKRNTFLISPASQIVKVYFGVDPTVHAEQIIQDLKIFTKS